MPYHTIEDLPDSVRHHLPKEAQEIYLKAFNSAYHMYQNPEKRMDPSESLDAVAAKVAWSAVKKEYHKSESGDKWVKNK